MDMIDKIDIGTKYGHNRYRYKIDKIDIVIKYRHRYNRYRYKI